MGARSVVSVEAKIEGVDDAVVGPIPRTVDGQDFGRYVLVVILGVCARDDCLAAGDPLD